jgi:hypothetical protein
MSYFSSSARYDTNEEVIFKLKAQLVLRGWLVKSSSDGLTYNSTGDQITTSGTGAGGLTNASAWFRIQCPSMGGVTRELTFQRSTTQNYRVKYSYSAGFTGGTPGITQTPSATDEKLIVGTGTDAAPTYALFFNGTGRYYAMSLGDSSEGYSFFYATITASTISVNGVTNSFFMMDRISTSSVSVGDTDGYSFMFSPTTITTTTSATNNFSWFKKGLGGEGFVATPLFDWNMNGNKTYSVGSNASNQKCSLLPILYGRESTLAAPNGYKGFSHMVYLTTNKIFNFCPISVFANNDKIILDIFALPWDTTTLVQYG